MPLNEDRQKTINKIHQLEREKKWDIDVEDDPPTKPLLPSQIDYLNKKLKNKILNKVANFAAVKYFDKEIKKGNLVIKNVVGFENYEKVKNQGVILTCNHFNPYDNYIVFKTLQKSLKKQHKNLWKVIREGNYTNFPGLFGFIFRHCNTLPLSSNMDTMKLFISSTSTLLKRNEKILIYPEQAMWWNYRKPRPCKSGAFKIAALNNCPILPCFITMKDSNKVADDGSFIQEHTLHILEPIYPDLNKKVKERTEEMKNRNYEVWVETYEKVYKTKLEY